MNTAEKLTRWKQKLLDLGKRNRLLYFRPTRRTTLQLVYPGPEEVFSRLVIEGRPLDFPPSSPELLDDEEEQARVAAVPVAKPGVLLADQTGGNLEKSLYQLRQKAKTAVEEQGVTILYVAFGFLEWTESEASRDPIKSPLLLVPVELHQDSILDPYRLVPVDDDLVLNPTLVHKLHSDFGITLPDLPSDGDWRLEDLLDEIDGLVYKRGWSVHREVWLSLFAFLKLNMYKDLDRHAADMIEHPLIAAIAGDPGKLPPLPDDLLHMDLDRSVYPHDTYQVVDADSSQQEAILAAKRGISFVLQGPPGTGKSQTITNIIAECLAAGRRVLFVSEKMAALEVVHRRITEAGLTDFCLPLHSHNANKKEVVDELGRTLMADKSQVTAAAMDQLANLLSQRESLNEVVRALHAVREPLHKSVYQVHGEVAKLDAAPDVLFRFERVAQVTPTDLQRFSGLLDRLASTARRIGDDYLSNPWRGCTVPAYTLELSHDIKTRFTKLHSLLVQLEDAIREPSAYLNLSEPSSLKDAEAWGEILALAGDSPRPPVDWLVSDNLDPLTQMASAYQDLQEERLALRTKLFDRYAESVLTLDSAACLTQLTAGADEAMKTFRRDNVTKAEKLFEQRDRLTAFLKQVQVSVGGLLETAAYLASLLGLDAPMTLAACRLLAQLASCVARDPRPAMNWFAQASLRSIMGLGKEAQQHFEGLAECEESLFANYDRDVMSQGISEMLQRFRTEYSGILRFLKPGYHRDRKTLRSFLKQPTDFSYQRALTDLSTMKEIADHRTWISGNNDAMAEAFGDWFQGAQTDWSGLAAALQTTGDISNHFRPDPVPAALQELLIRSGAPVNHAMILSERLQSAVNDAAMLLEPIQRLSTICEAASSTELMEEMALTAFVDWAGRAAKSLSPIYQAFDSVRAHRLGAGSLTYQMCLDDLRDVQRVQNIDADVTVHLEELKAMFGRFFQGTETDWQAVFQALDWAGKVRAQFLPSLPPERFAQLICATPEAAKVANEAAIRCGTLQEAAQAEARYVAGLFEKYLVDLEKLPFAPAKVWLQDRLSNLMALEDWVDFRRSRADCERDGLGIYVQMVVEQRIPPDDIKPAFFKRFYRLWLDVTYAQVPELASFRGRRHEERIQAFRELDRLQFRIAQSRLRAKLSEKRPNPHIMAPTGSEVAILLRETEKRRKLKPLRKLFQEIPNLLLTLKPCLLMSPLSVSQYLDPQLYQFDTVVFDEASQICPEDAVGAVFRGQQVIVVGDREQLPPTNFFSVSMGDSAYDDEEDDTEAYESILDECSSVFHRKSLQWHYRSRHEHLIAFSNARIYKNLVTFPSPAGRVPGLGVEYIKVKGGVYDRSSSRANKAEAERVAEMVFDHFREFGESRSLGVVTFSEAQQSSVDAAIRQLRLRNPEMELFFREDRDEPFFVKNLENVQGDERDTIIFSIGYAKDQTGVMHMNFGPLSRQGGYRRLNVAITRAKYNVKLVGSVDPTDIDLERTSADGVKMLRLYMEFAIYGPQALDRELVVSGTKEFDSPFEEAVYQELTRLGWEVDTQVGCSGYRIDLAIKDPDNNGHYLLGIECDGATYHSAKTARDRDRLREDVLQGLGWTIHRIWSTDWVKDPQAEVLRVLQAVDAAHVRSKGCVASNTNPLAAPKPEVPLELTMSPEEEAELLEGLPGTMEYTETNIWSVKRKPGQGDPEFAAAVVEHVITSEGPIHVELLTKRLAPLFGKERVGSTLRREVQWVVNQFGKGRWAVRGDFLWPVGMSSPPVRTAGQRRAIGHVCVEELAEAVIIILERAMGMGLDELIVETARLLGFSRTGGQIREAVLAAIAALEGSGRVEMQDMMIRLVRGAGQE